MSEYTGKKRFVIYPNDAGTEAYRDGYVEWLEKEIEQFKQQVEDANIAGFREGFNGAEEQLAELKADVDRLNTLLAASEHLLAIRERITWGYEPELRTRRYFLDGEYAGTTLREVIEAAADRKGV